MHNWNTWNQELLLKNYYLTKTAGSLCCKVEYHLEVQARTGEVSDLETVQVFCWNLLCCKSYAFNQIMYRMLVYLWSLTEVEACVRYLPVFLMLIYMLLIELICSLHMSSPLLLCPSVNTVRHYVQDIRFRLGTFLLYRPKELFSCLLSLWNPLSL